MDNNEKYRKNKGKNRSAIGHTNQISPMTIKEKKIRLKKEGKGSQTKKAKNIYCFKCNMKKMIVN